MTKGDPMIVNIESEKKFGMRKKKAKKPEPESETETEESHDSVIKADQVAIMEPILKQLKKTLIDDEKKAKRKAKSKSKSKIRTKKSKKNPYNYVRSKVAKSINGHYSTKSYWKPKRKRRNRRRAKSLAAARKIRRAKSLRAKSVRLVKKKSRKQRTRVRSRFMKKRGPKTEAISESGYSYKPLNIHTEVAVKLFSKKSKRTKVASTTAFSRKSKSRKFSSKSQASWVKRNA